MLADEMRFRIGDVFGASLARFVAEAGYERRGSIPDGVTFRAWCDDLAAKGLKVDGHPFTLANRPSMHFIYDLIPSTIEEARGRTIVMMKCAQVGFTVMEMLATIYLALRFEPCKIGMYLPDAKLAGIKSTIRYMPILRLVPDAYARLTEEDPATGRKRSGEGNVLTRQLGDSTVLFLWTSGKAMTESMPMDYLSFDEVQEMSIESMEKTAERLSASNIKLKIMGSTANFADSDIHYWYKRGTQHQFHTACRACGGSQIMDEYFPPAKGGKSCIGWDETRDDWRYQCVTCDAWIDDPQDGEWIAAAPNAYDPVTHRGIESVHYPQFLSPTITPREMIESYNNATNLKNWFNRKAGKPYADPSQVPVTLEHLRAAAAAGVKAGLVWRKSGRDTLMGVDNMGGFSCVVIVERMANGLMALIHCEQIHALNPWARLDELMTDYRVAVAVCEQLPNYDSAKGFASRWPGRVFLVSAYVNIEDDMLRWGDAAQSKADRKTVAEHRDKHTVSLDQFKMMSWAFGRIVNGTFLTPDPNLLMQEILIKNVPQTVAILSKVLWEHFQKTALVTEIDEDEHKMKRRVQKIGIDPHFSFALMMACAAWCRSYGTTTFIMPDTAPATLPAERAAQAVAQAMPGLPEHVLAHMADLPPSVCGRCTAFEDGVCTERGFNVGRSDPSCPVYSPRGLAHEQAH